MMSQTRRIGINIWLTKRIWLTEELDENKQWERHSERFTTCDSRHERHHFKTLWHKWHHGGGSQRQIDNNFKSLIRIKLNFNRTSSITCFTGTARLQAVPSPPTALRCTKQQICFRWIFDLSEMRASWICTNPACTQKKGKPLWILCQQQQEQEQGKPRRSAANDRNGETAIMAAEIWKALIIPPHSLHPAINKCINETRLRDCFLICASN